MSDPRAEFAQRLNRARVERGLSIRAAAKIAGMPSATVQGWLRGRHLPTVALRPHYLKLVNELGLTDELPLDWWADGWRSLQPVLRDGNSPYLGLRPFGVADADMFYGRGAEVTRLAQAVKELYDRRRSGVVALVGSSGSGKSSLLAAGLAAGACTDGPLAGWTAVVCHPEDDLRLAGEGADLQVIDQFEEILSAEPSERARLMAELAQAAEQRILVVGLRSDAFAAALAEPLLNDALSRPVLLAPLTRAEVREVIVAPAELRGVRVHEDLIRALELDLAAGPADSAIAADVLPLLSNALLVTWAAGSGQQMSLADYQSAGGAATAVESLAEEVYAALSRDQQEAIEALFLRLIRLTDEAVVAQPVRLDDVDAATRPALDAFVSARMLTVSDDSVRISHEALIRHWSRLKEWVARRQGDLRALANVRRATRVWLDSGRADAALIPVQQLGFFADWLDDVARQRLLNAEETDFLAASQAHHESVLAAERRVSARLRTRGRLAIGLAAAATALALVAGLLFFQARASEEVARVATEEALSRQVALTSRSLRTKDANLVTQMATVAASLADTQEARSALLDATSVDAPLRWAGEPSAVLAALTADGLVARGGGAGTVTLWRDGDLTSLGTDFLAGDSAVLAVALGRVGGRQLLAAGGKGFSGLWDVTDEPQQLAVLGDTEVQALTFAPNGSRLLLGTAAGAIVSYDISDPANPRRQLSVALDPESDGPGAVPPPVRSLVMTSDQVLFVGGPLGSIARWQLAQDDAARLPDLPNLYIPTGGTELAATRTQALAVSPDGTRLAAGQGGRAALLWRLADGEATGMTVVRGFNSWVNAVGFSADSTRLITGSSDQDVTVVELAPDAELRRITTPAVVTGVALLGGAPVAVGEDGSLRAWPALSPVLRQPQSIPSYNLSTDASGEGWLAADNSYGSINLWRVAGDAVERWPDPVVTLPEGDAQSSAIAVARSGGYLVGASGQGRLISWPLTEDGAGEPIVLETGLGSIATAKVSPDSSLVAAVEDQGPVVALAHADSRGKLTLAGRLPASAESVDFSFDNQILAVARGELGVELWSVADPASPSRLGVIPTAKGAQKIAASRVAPLLAVGEATGVVTLWDITDPASPTKVREFTDPAAAVYSVDFNPDGTMILAAAADDRIWAWDLASEGTQARYVLDGAFGRPWDARFVADGRGIAATGGDGQIKLWAADPATARAQLCAARGTALTPDEWQRFLPGVDPADPC